MKLKPTHYKAIDWYCQEHNYRPELSAVPTMRFTDKATGKKVERDLEGILLAYGQWKEEDKKQRATARRREREFQKQLEKQAKKPAA